MQRLTPILATFSLAVACTIPDPATSTTTTTSTTATTTSHRLHRKRRHHRDHLRHHRRAQGRPQRPVLRRLRRHRLPVRLQRPRARRQPRRHRRLPLPADRFACGWRLCLLASEYCEQHAYLVIPGVYKHAFLCKPLPDACEPEPTCACLQGERCGTSCATSPEGGLKLDCDGDGGESG